MAGAGSSIGSIYARIGADTSDFQAKLAAGNIQLSNFAAGASRAGLASSSGLALAGATALSVGGRLRGLAAATAVLSGSSVAQYALIGNAALHMGGSMMEGSKAILSMNAMLSSVSTIAVGAAGGLAGLILSAAAVGVGIGTLINKLSGANVLFQDGAGPIKVYAEELVASEERFQSAAAQYEHMRASLKLSGPEWDFQAVRTKENAQRLSELIDRITQEGQVVRSTKATRDGYTQYYIDLGNKIRSNQQVLAAYTEQTNKFYGVVTKSTVRDELKKTMVDLQVMQKEGIDSQQIIEAAGPKILEVVEQAKKMGLDVPPLLDNMADAIKSKNDLWVGDLMASLGRVPEDLKAASAANAAELERVGQQFKDGIKGGFTAGTKEGLDSMQEQLATAAANLKLTIPVEFARPDLDNLIRSILRGSHYDDSGFTR